MQDFAFINHVCSLCWKKSKMPTWTWAVRPEAFAQVSNSEWAVIQQGGGGGGSNTGPEHPFPG